MTTNHHLKSFLWFPYEQSKCPRNHVSAQTPSPSFLFTLKMSSKNPLPSLGFGKWDHCSPLHLEGGSGLVLSWISWATPGHSVRDVSLFRPKTTTEKHPSPGSLECSFLVAASTSPIFYQQMKEFYNTFCHYQ